MKYTTSALPGTTYVSGQNVRGTTTILWNCLSIIFLCTWNIQHLNVSAARPQTDSTLQSIWWAILDSRRRIKWMVFTMIVPEYLVGKAFGEWLGAKRGVPEMVFNADDGIEWGKIHSYIANMGYFVVDFSDLLVNEQARPFPSQVSSLKDISSIQQINFRRLQHRCWALNTAQLHEAVERGLVDLPRVSSRQLEKLDRGEKLARALALIQITYLIVQLIARKVLKLPSTQLEIAALAFSVSSIITYILYWHRLQGVDSVHVMKAKQPLDGNSADMIAIYGPVYLWTHPRTRTRLNKKLDLALLPNDGVNFTPLLYTRQISQFVGYNADLLPLIFGAIVGGTLFGGLHCLAWDFQFPSSAEKLAWRICSVLTASLPILMTVPLSFRLFRDELAFIYRRIHSLIVISLLVTYILARLFLMVEIFRSLFFLPPEAFIDTWSGSFPHFS
ncbi:hypothetical protein EG329_002505 [Mollisiaceae sp. DMI_Dod_QoI]|nr:hypothetical protein EG329_002505 [Helotiales sp. DMI_Dod_QoI]